MASQALALVWSDLLNGVQEVAGSNPVAPTQNDDSSLSTFGGELFVVLHQRLTRNSQQRTTRSNEAVKFISAARRIPATSFVTIVCGVQIQPPPLQFGGYR